MCLAQGHNAVTQARLGTRDSSISIKHSTTETLGSECKLVTEQYQLVSDMLIDMLAQIKLQFTPLPVKKCRDGKGPNYWEQRFIVWNYKGKGGTLDR